MLGHTPPQEIRVPLLSVWRRPQATVRYLIARGGWAWAPALLMVAFALATMWQGEVSNAPLHWLVLMILGAGAGVVELLLAPLLLKLTGKPLFGRATFRELVIALAWAGIPASVAYALYLATSALTQHKFAQFINRIAEGNTSIAPGEGMYVVPFVVCTILFLWTLWMVIRTIGAVQQFGWFRSFLNIFFGYGLLLLFGLALRVLLWHPFSIPSSSMAPTLQVGDYVFGDKLIYGYGPYSLPFETMKEGRLWGGRPTRGDIVIFRMKDGSDWVKRVVGLPGDDIQMIKGVLQINGLPVKMTYLREEKPNEKPNFSGTARVYKETLPNGVSYEIYKLVQRGDAGDTQAFHVPPGHYFMMGDNRDNSTDSRFPKVGHVPYESIIAKVSVIYFSASTPKPDSMLQAFSNLNWQRMFRRP